ncbi:MAG: molybdopterin-dependent oxidoreductase, partial [Rhodospirillales bacterium]
KPYAFVARPWELSKTETIDVMDAVGSNIRVDARGREVLRVLPRLNEEINEEWISDKTRFACDGLRRQRLDRPYVRIDGKLCEMRWQDAFAAIANRVKGLPGARIAAIAGDLADCEAMVALKDLMAGLGSPHLDCRQDGAALVAEPRSAYLFNTTIAGIESASACLLIGTNPRREAPIINARLRKRYRAGSFPIGVIGPAEELTYAYEHLGNDPRVLDRLASGDHGFTKALRESERPMIIVGMGALARPDGAAVLAATRRLAQACRIVRPDSGWNGFNVLHTAAARVGGLDLGFLPGRGGRDLAGILAGATSSEIEVVYLLGADELPMERLGKAFVVYQGHHGDAGAHRADVILPGAAYTEKNAAYVNTEGRVQMAMRCCDPPGEAREDWKILRALSDAVGCSLPFETLADVRARLREVNSVFAEPNMVRLAPWGAFGQAGTLSAVPLASPVANFYMTNAISRASVTMAECTKLFTGGADEKKTGTHG